MRICVYLGSRSGNDEHFIEAAQALGTAIAQRGWELVYGGANNGLMGAVANACVKAGGKAYGVIPENLMQKEVANENLTELIHVNDMHERKSKMAELADAFVMLPGGIGTFEEFFEIWTWHYLRIHEKPISVLNVADFYKPLLAFLDNTVAHGFLDQSTRDALIESTDIEDLLNRIESAKVA